MTVFDALALAGPVAAAVTESVAQSGIGDLVEGAPTPREPTGAAIYGGSGLAGAAGLRSLVRRVRGNSGSGARRSGGTSVSTGGSTAGGSSVATTSRSTATKHNVAFTLPSFVPVSEGIRHVTHTEIHAFEIGLVVGLAVSWLNSLGRTEPAVAIVVAVIAGGLGFKAYSSRAFRTIRHEPWYAFVAMAIAAAAGYVYFGGAPA